MLLHLRLGKVLYLLLFLRFPGRDCKLHGVIEEGDTAPETVLI